ncbi:MAG: hypothetical protein JNK85_02980 [Verrucomicrobiales bacterium]|nr:hypothetical protein [Verrucomicrobiales bacterium]
MKRASFNSTRCWSWLRLWLVWSFAFLLSWVRTPAAQPAPSFTVEAALRDVGREPSPQKAEALRFLMQLDRSAQASLARALEGESVGSTKLSGALLEAASVDDDERALLAIRTMDHWSASAESGLARMARGTKAKHHERVAAQFRSLGGTVFLREDAIVEVVLNGCRLVDTDLRGLRGLREITDLSLERTPIGDGGMHYLADLTRLEWLNLFLTQVSDEGLVHLKKLRRLERLPVGGTRVTDAGLKMLGELPSLKYLGLRGTRVTDAGMSALASMVSLTELNLGDTAVTDAGLESLSSLKSLRVLYLGATPVTDVGLARLSRALPECTIHR